MEKLTNEARRIQANIADLPELWRRPAPADQWRHQLSTYAFYRLT